MHKEIIDQVVALGYEVWMMNHDDTYLYFVKDGKFGYLQYNESTGLSISSCHKPDRFNGVGFRLYDGDNAEINEQQLKQACDGYVPWLPNKGSDLVARWADFEEFLSNRGMYRDLYKVAAPAQEQ